MVKKTLILIFAVTSICFFGISIASNGPTDMVLQTEKDKAKNRNQLYSPMQNIKSRSNVQSAIIQRRIISKLPIQREWKYRNVRRVILKVQVCPRKLRHLKELPMKIARAATRK